MMRNYTNFDRFVSSVQQDVLPQPPDPGHTAWGVSAIQKMLGVLGNVERLNVLDVGCGQAPFAGLFEGHPYNMYWRGVTIGEDFAAANLVRPGHVYHEDMSFLPFADALFDVVFCRHALEHSPFPLLTLMEWHRVAKNWLMLIVPGEYWGVRGRNHYSVLSEKHWTWLLERSGWHPLWTESFFTTDPLFLEHTGKGVAPDLSVVEYRFLCEKRPEVYE